MKHPTKREAKRIEQITSELEHLFSVNNFDRSFAYKSSDPENGCCADIAVDVPYQRVHINIYPRFWEHSLEDQREFILHEFCHILIHPVQQVAIDLFNGKFRTEKERQDAVEQSTSRVTQILDAQLRGKDKYASIAYAKYLKK